MYPNRLKYWFSDSKIFYKTKHLYSQPNKVEEERSPQFSPVNSESAHSDDAYKDELVRAKEELQTLRLQLELAETKAKLEQQKKQVNTFSKTSLRKLR